MSVSIAEPRRVPEPRTLLRPIVCTVALLVAVFVAPFPVASAWSDGGYPSRAALVDSLSAAFVHYWDAGSGVIGPDLALPVDFWARFHVVKAALAAILLVALARLGSRTWVVYTRAATATRRLLAGVLVGMAALALLALLVLVANVQGAIAPLSSALGLLPMGRPDPALAGTITQVRDGLAGEARSPALGTLVHDFTAYHIAMAGLGAVVTAGLLATAVLLWRRRARMSAGRRGRHLTATAVVAVMASSAFFGVVTAANLSTVADPAPALLGFFQGGG